MKRAFLLVFAFASAAAVEAGGSFTGWMETYYSRKEDSRLLEFWDRTVEGGALEALPRSRDIMIGFFGAALRKHPEIVQARVKSLNQFPKKQRDALSIILWLADSDYARQLLRQAGLHEMALAPCPPTKDRKIYSADDANFIVGWFYATGDAGALSPLVNCVRTADWSASDDKAEACGAALEVLCEQHERVRVVVEEALKSKDLSDNARKVFVFALRKGGANQPSEPTPTSGTSLRSSLGCQLPSWLTCNVRQRKGSYEL